MGRWIVVAMAMFTLSLAAPSAAAELALGDAIPSQAQLTFIGQRPAWAAAATSLMAELEQWRGLPFLADLQVRVHPAEVPGLNGWYDPQTQELVVATQDSRLGRGVLLHELFHGLQDQHFDLQGLQQHSPQPEAALAVDALVEGEAMLAVSELMNYDFLAHAQLPAVGPISDELFENLFLYGAGLQFVTAVRQAGGWEAVGAAFTDPPQATTLIFHPQRYIAGARQGAAVSVPVTPGETLQQQAPQGEYQLRRQLAQRPETRPWLQSLGDSYVGDALGRVQTAEGQVVHRWVIALQDEATAASLAEMFATKALVAEAIAVVTDGASVLIEW